VKKFKVIINGDESEIYADSLKLAKGILRRKLNKRRLAGVQITKQDNNNHAELKPLSAAPKAKCYICGETRNEELTVDDSFIKNIICEKCLKEQKKGKRKESKAMPKFQLDLF
jgi:hypothetical protein